MEWNEIHRRRLYDIIARECHQREVGDWESWLSSLGIKWAELDEVKDAPQGTVAIWEGPGFINRNRKNCWVVPDDVALKLLTLNT